jgi:uncharacterized protein YukE
VSDGQFGVEPDRLTRLGGRFEEESTSFTGQVNAFAAGAGNIGQAFGLLGVCDDAAQKYQKLLQSTVTALGRLSQVLADDARGLRANAADYAASERTALAHIGSAGGK